MNRSRLIKMLFFLALAGSTAALAYFLYLQRPIGLPTGLAAGNGRLEAIEVDVATKIAGRLGRVDVREGDQVQAGAVLARLDADDLRAQLRLAEAQARQARQAVNEARAGVRKADSDVLLAGKTLQRSRELVGRGFISGDKLDRDSSGLQGVQAGRSQAQSRVAEAEAAVAAADARVDSLKVNVNDTDLKAPISGRVLYRLAESGEVLAAGGKVLTLLDLSDMYLTIYLPTETAGQVALNSEARIVLDALPGQVIPGRVSFVAPKAQFTPREVETRSEREKLMFRLKIKPDPAWLEAHADLAKAGMPGVSYVRLQPDAAWPANLQVSGK